MRAGGCAPAPDCADGPGGSPAPRRVAAALVPGTVAARAAHGLDLAGDIDAVDWWYRDDRSPRADDGGPSALPALRRAWPRWPRCGSTARASLTAQHVPGRTGSTCPRGCATENELVIGFRSLAQALEPRRAAAAVEDEARRPPEPALAPDDAPGSHARAGRRSSPPVGPWAPVGLEARNSSTSLTCACTRRHEARSGLVRLRARSRPRRSDRRRATCASASRRACRARRGRRIARPRRRRGPTRRCWWPHTHGDAAARAVPPRASQVGGELDAVDCGRVGLSRRSTVDTDGGRVRFGVNGVPVFCRGACWTSSDILACARVAGATARATSSRPATPAPTCCASAAR